MLLSTHVERFSVSCLQDFLNAGEIKCQHLTLWPQNFNIYQEHLNSIHGQFLLYFYELLSMNVTLIAAVVQYGAVHCNALHCIAQHWSTLYCTALPALQWPALHWITLYYTHLHCKQAQPKLLARGTPTKPNTKLALQSWNQIVCSQNNIIRHFFTLYCHNY